MAYEVDCMADMLWTEKSKESMYMRPMIQEPMMLPTMATGANSSVRRASSATWAAVSHPKSA